MQTSYNETRHRKRNVLGGKMPFKSKKQKTYLKINEPDLAEKWEKKYGKDIVAGIRGGKKVRRNKKGR